MSLTFAAGSPSGGSAGTLARPGRFRYCHDVASTVPFEYLANFLTVPVTAGKTETRFIFDTGIGINLVSKSVATLAGCSPNGTSFTGRRMSGQEVTIPLGSLRSLTIGNCQREDVPTGIFDLGEMAGLDGIGGFLSLDYFRSIPVTVDYPNSTIVIEDTDSLARRAAAGAVVSVRVEHDACSTSVFLPLDLPGGRSASVEVDTGSSDLILDIAFADDLGVDLGDQSIRNVEGHDETGNAFARYFASLRGEISVTGAPAICQADPAAMFQKIIYDGLVGDAFLRNFIVTYDLSHDRMIFARHSEPPQA